MVQVIVVHPDGRREAIAVPTGRSLMRGAVAAGVEGIAADCGGCLSCATCHVYIDPAWVGRLPPPDAEEASMLQMTAAEQKPTSRLSCQIAMEPHLAGLTVHLPETQY